MARLLAILGAIAIVFCADHAHAAPVLGARQVTVEPPPAVTVTAAPPTVPTVTATLPTLTVPTVTPPTITASLPTLTLPTTFPEPTVTATLPSLTLPTTFSTTVPVPFPTGTINPGPRTTPPLIVPLPGYARASRFPLTTATTTTTMMSTTTEAPGGGGSTDTMSTETQTQQQPSATVAPPDTFTVTGTIPAGQPSATLTVAPGSPSVSVGPQQEQDMPTTTDQGSDTATTTTTTAMAQPTGDSVVAVAQALAMFAPEGADATDPYSGPFDVFRAANLSPEQELRLANRTFYFKGARYDGAAQVQISANETAPGQSVMGGSLFNLNLDPQQQVPNVLFPVANSFQLAWASPNHPPESRTRVQAQANGVISLLDSTFSGLPPPVPDQDLPGFVPVSPKFPDSISLMPYQVAPLARGMQLSASPLPGSAVSYMVLVEGNQPMPMQTTTSTSMAATETASPQQAPQETGLPPQLSPQNQSVQHFAVMSDIDDVLKITNVTEPWPALINTFAGVYEPILGMPNALRAMADRGGSANPQQPNRVSFHYLSGSPMPLAPGLLQFLWAYFPPGSLTLRETTGFDPQTFYNYLTQAPGDLFRSEVFDEVLNTFPAAQGVIIGDTTKSAYSAYMRVVEQYPSRVQCIYLRNITETGGAGQNNPVGSFMTGLQLDDALDQLRSALPQDQQARAEQMLVPFQNPSAILGFDWGSGRCA